jgi:hypothetical protein
MIEVTTHGQDLTAEWLDELFVSIRDRIPDRQWVEITKNKEKVIAGVKHIIDCDCFGANFELVFNNDYTHFKKRIKEDPIRELYPNKYVNTSIWTKENDELRIKQESEQLKKIQNGKTRKNRRTRSRN